MFSESNRGGDPIGGVGVSPFAPKERKGCSHGWSGAPAQPADAKPVETRSAFFSARLDRGGGGRIARRSVQVNSPRMSRYDSSILRPCRGGPPRIVPSPRVPVTSGDLQPGLHPQAPIGAERAPISPAQVVTNRVEPPHDRGGSDRETAVARFAGRRRLMDGGGRIG